MTAVFPPGATDTHLHVYDQRYPTAPDAVVLAPDASVEEYLRLHRELGIERVVVVQPSAYGLDNRLHLDAMREFASSGVDARGVMVVDAATPADELVRLAELGVRGARFHMLPGGAVGWNDLEPVAAAIAPLDWHVQLQLDGNELGGLVERLAALPCPLVIDHVGRFMPPPEPDSAAFGALLELVAAGRTWVKLSAPYESLGDETREFAAVSALVEVLVERHADRLLWASNWPHPGQPDPLTPADVAELAARWIPASLRRHVFVDNPGEVYGFGAT